MRGWLVILIFIGLWKAIFSGCTYPGHGPNSMTNLLISNKERFYAGEVAIYTCDPGFELYGPDQRTCLCDDTWTEEMPFCGNDVNVYMETKDEKTESCGVGGDPQSNQDPIVYFLYPERGATVMISLFLKNNFIPDSAVVEYSFVRSSMLTNEENRTAAFLQRRTTGEIREKGDAYFFVDTRDFETYLLKIKINQGKQQSDAFKIINVQAIELAGNLYSWCSLEYYQNGGFEGKEAICAGFYKDITDNKGIVPQDQYCKLFLEEGEVEACIFAKTSHGFLDEGHPQCDYYKEVTSYDKNMPCSIYSALADQAAMHACKEGFVTCYKGMYNCGFPSQNPNTMAEFSRNGRELKVTYRCPTGDYDLIGPKQRTCRGNGKWTDVAPSCVFGSKAKSYVDNEHESKQETKKGRDSGDLWQWDLNIVERVFSPNSTANLLVLTMPLVFVFLILFILMAVKCVYNRIGIQRQKMTLEAKSKPKNLNNMKLNLRNETDELLSLEKSMRDYKGRPIPSTRPVLVLGLKEGGSRITTVGKVFQHCERKQGAYRTRKTKERGFNQQPTVEEDEETYKDGKWHYL